MALLPRVWRELWAPLASLAPAVILYVPHISSYLPSFMWLLAAFWQWWSDPLSPFSPSGTQGWQRKSGGDGAWRLFDESFLSVPWAQDRILSMETARHSFAPQHFSFPIVLRCLLLHSQWHLAAVEYSCQGDKCGLHAHLRLLFVCLLSAHTQADFTSSLPKHQHLCMSLLRDNRICCVEIGFLSVALQRKARGHFNTQ